MLGFKHGVVVGLVVGVFAMALWSYRSHYSWEAVAKRAAVGACGQIEACIRLADRSLGGGDVGQHIRPGAK